MALADFRVGLTFGAFQPIAQFYFIKRKACRDDKKDNLTSEYLVEAGANLPQTIRNWRQVLHRLMADFLAGNATIDPKDGNNTCNNSYCELQPLCRIGELAQLEITSRTVASQEPST